MADRPTDHPPSRDALQRQQHGSSRDGSGGISRAGQHPAAGLPAAGRRGVRAAGVRGAGPRHRLPKALDAGRDSPGTGGHHYRVDTHQQCLCVREHTCWRLAAAASSPRSLPHPQCFCRERRGFSHSRQLLGELKSNGAADCVTPPGSFVTPDAAADPLAEPAASADDVRDLLVSSSCAWSLSVCVLLVHGTH